MATATASATAHTNALAPEMKQPEPYRRTVRQQIKTSVELGQSLTAQLSAITDDKKLYKMYIRYIMEVDFVYGTGPAMFQSQDDILRWVEKYVGPGPEPFPYMVKDLRQELKNHYKPIAEDSHNFALNTVYSAVEKRLTGPDSAKQDPILDKFVLAYHGHLPGVTVKAQWGDYLCVEAYNIVKDDPAL
jgi:hypothetical protein